MYRKERRIGQMTVSERVFERIKQLNMTQKEFAEFVCTSKRTVERWERSNEKITGPIVLLLNMIENNLDYIETIEIPEKKLPLRMFYMNEQKICTLIDVDDVNQSTTPSSFTSPLMGVVLLCA